MGIPHHDHRRQSLYQRDVEAEKNGGRQWNTDQQEKWDEREKKRSGQGEESRGCDCPVALD